MNPFPAIPFVRFCIACILGIMFYNFAPNWYSFVLVLGGIMMFVLMFSPASFASHPQDTQWLGLSVYFVWICIGYIFASIHSPDAQKPTLDHCKIYAVRLIENPVEKSKSYKAEAELLFAAYEKQSFYPNTGILLYFEKDSLASTLRHGDELTFTSQVTTPYTPQNPRQFNYARYLQSQGIYYQSYLKKNSYLTIARNTSRGWKHYLLEIRYTIVNMIRKMGFTETEFGIASALLTGYKEELDPDTKASFSKVGAMHILAVSGLHVGVIYLMINKLLFFLTRQHWQRMLRLTITLFVLWMYALITGMSPSVMRAGIMFSFIATGASLSYKTNIYNTIALSALILLIANPFNLYNVGFQLSYLAVLGIVYFFPYLKTWVNSRFWIVNQIWAISAVSFSAQLATTPISLYHFGQFPTSFLIANLIVVPLSGIIIYTGVAALIFFYVPFLSDISIFCFRWLIRIMHQIILQIETLPYAYATNLNVTVFQSVLLYAIVLFATWFLLYKKGTYLILFLSCLFVMMLTMTIRNWRVNHQQELIIYAMNRDSRLEVISGRHIFYPDFEVLSPMEYGLFVRANHQWRGIRKQISVQEMQFNMPLLFRGPLLIVGNKKIWIWDEENQLPSHSMHVDYLWVKSKVIPRTDIFENYLMPDLFIIDPCLTDYRRKKWIEWCDLKQYSYYDLKNSGAFILPLNE